VHDPLLSTPELPRKDPPRVTAVGCLVPHEVDEVIVDVLDGARLQAALRVDSVRWTHAEQPEPDE
jgi:hypothetical protein